MPENAGPRPYRAGPQAPTATVSPNERARLVLRIAWLRVHGQQMFEVDPTGQLSAQLWDLADVLERLDAEGRVSL